MSEQSQKNIIDKSQELLAKGCGTVQAGLTATAAAVISLAEMQKKRSEETHRYANRLAKMTRKQLRGELKHQLRYQPGQKEAGVELLALAIIFDSTSAPDNPKGKVGVYPV